MHVMIGRSHDCGSGCATDPVGGLQRWFIVFLWVFITGWEVLGGILLLVLHADPYA